MKIKELKKSKLIELALKIKPVMRVARKELTLSYDGTIHSKNKLVYIEPTDIINTTFTWDPKYCCDTPKFEKVGKDITTIHSYGHPLLFKPSVEEVLCQIPESYLSEDIVAFEVYLDSEQAREIIYDDYHHFAHVRFYKLAEGEKVPNIIENQEVICDGKKYTLNKFNNIDNFIIDDDEKTF